MPTLPPPLATPLVSSIECAPSGFFAPHAKFLDPPLRRRYNGAMDSVKVGALNGVAAKLISGRSLHSMFKLPVQRGGKLEKLPNLSGVFNGETGSS